MHRLTPVVLTAAGLAAAHVAPWMSFTEPGRLLFPVVTRVPSSNAVGLTFDDGPDGCLDDFLELLERRNAQATFFLMGEQVERFPDAPAKIRDAGHEVAVHGWNHRGHLRRTPGDVRDDLARARALIESAADLRTTLYRPPYGAFSLGSWMATGAQGWNRVLWSRWGRDWEATTSAERIAETIGYPTAGDILLLHDSDRYSAPDSWRRTLASLPIILDRLDRAGLVARSVSSMLSATS